MAGVPKEHPPEHLVGDERTKWLLRAANRRAYKKKRAAGMKRIYFEVPAHEADDIRTEIYKLLEERNTTD